jgi:hypothetical protein
MGRYVHVYNLPSTVLDDEPDVEELELNRWHDEKIHGGDRVAVVSKERGPALASVEICSFRLRKKPGTHRKRVVASLSRCHVARSILHGVAAQCETDSSTEFGPPFSVD